MKAFRIIFAIALIAHGLAHASAGMWATDIGGRTLVTLLWELSAVGFMAGGVGLLGSMMLRKRWRVCVTIAALSSLALLLLYSHPLFIAGIVADLFAIAVAVATLRSRFDESIGTLRLLMAGILFAFMGYTGVIIAARSWYSSWGTTRSEQQMPLIGDPPLGQS